MLRRLFFYDLDAISFALFRAVLAVVPEILIYCVLGAIVGGIHVIVAGHGDLPAVRRAPYHISAIPYRLVFFRLVAILPDHPH